ncbi:hypothetical protein SRB5_53980 [Streptomyces sp. RB5]|uniref:Uncharacterized protein n=1 Tax=Streptomyces smaragdinus TaxID=2585196 RepID=A0A7K0CP44_9ACTN|nr:hypothetical protein [Streptomyces smaragdinus]
MRNAIRSSQIIVKPATIQRFAAAGLLALAVSVPAAAASTAVAMPRTEVHAVSAATAIVASAQGESGPNDGGEGPTRSTNGNTWGD